MARAQLICLTEHYMDCCFFTETKSAIEKIVGNVFYEFKETMHQIWKTIFENFETIKPLPCFAERSSSFREQGKTENQLYDLPPMIKMYYEFYQKQRIEALKKKPTVRSSNESWAKRIYINFKKR